MGIHYVKRISENAQLGLWEITESWQELKELVQLTESDELFFSKKKTDIRRQEWLACRALLKSMTDKHAAIAYHENGKPYIEQDDHFISISHSGNYAGVYLNEKKTVGIDIQKIKPNISLGADFFLNASEQVWVDLGDTFLMNTIWSAKESAFKYAGNPELDLKKHIITNPFSGNQKGLIEVNLIFVNDTETIRVQFDKFEEYVLTWTV